jgi:membrane-bound lytic murein transglycosylase D
MAIRIPKSKSEYVKANLAWFTDSLSNPTSQLLAGIDEPEIISKPASAESTRVQSSIYKVRSGDVLGTIASRNGVTVTALKEWNNLSSNLIKVGQELKISSGTKSIIAQVSTNSGGKTLYIVQPGDSLWIISKKNPGLTVELIKRLNNLNNNTIKPGQRLIIS